MDADVEWLLAEAKMLEQIAASLTRTGQHKARYFMQGQADRLRRVAGVVTKCLVDASLGKS